MDSTETIVPVAYVTRWATTRGIIVVRNAPTSERFPDRLWLNHQHIMPSEWTTDKAVAEQRWREAVDLAASKAEKKAANMRRMYAKGPKYAEKPAGGEGA